MSAASPVSLPAGAPTGRRPSFRANKPVMPYEGAPTDDEKMINLDAAPASEAAALMPDEEMRTRRRGSQL